jgi:1-acyl-sn-glycerol-3-phosphate acyltransferase
VEPVWGLGKSILYPTLRFGFRLMEAGLDHVPRSGPVILASNHVSFLDPLFLLWIGDRNRRKVRFLAMAELWDSPLLRFFLVHTGQIPVTREAPGARASLSHAADALGAGECLGVFPEGRISEDLEPLAGKTGVARLAAQTGAPVVPVGVWGGHRLYPKGRPRRWRVGVAVALVVGARLSVDADEDVFDATDRIMGRITDCLAVARRTYPQQPRRRDDGWWVRGPDTAVVRPARRDALG